MELKRKQIKPGVALLEMRGRILMGPDCKLIDKEIDELIAANETRVIFDVSGVSQIDSAGVGQVVKSFARLQKSGGELRLAGVTGMLDGVFKITQVHKVIVMYPTPQAASEGF
jgi:anti-sigma B factor antagonist